MLDAAVSGFLTGLSLIVAIGAQNAFVLRQGILRQHVAPVVGVCAVSDLVLFAAGVSGVGAMVSAVPGLLDVVRWVGVAFLLWFAVGALGRAFRPESLSAAGDPVSAAGRQAVAKAVALTWLNPHVFLDTLLIGSIAATHDDATGGPWWFAAGAGLASVVWFTGLGYGAGRLGPLLARPRAWQMLEFAIATTMLGVAAMLALG